MPDPQSAAKTAADLYLQLGIYGFLAVAFVLLTFALIWYLLRQCFAGLQMQREEHSKVVNSLGDKHVASLEKVTATYEKTNQVLRQDIGEKVDALSEKVYGLDCQRIQRNGKPGC